MANSIKREAKDQGRSPEGDAGVHLAESIGAIALFPENNILGT